MPALFRAGPLTYRTYDGRRKARFLDILSLFNRINNSNLRISELKILARELTQERIAFREVGEMVAQRKEIKDSCIFSLLNGAVHEVR